MQQGSTEKKAPEEAPSASGVRDVDEGGGCRPPYPRKKEKGVGVEATPTECATEGAREARPRPRLLRGTHSRTHLEPAREVAVYRPPIPPLGCLFSFFLFQKESEER